MAETLAAQLTRVQAAIAAIEEGAQSITAEDGRSLTRANLPALYRREESLRRRINFESTKGRTVAEF